MILEVVAFEPEHHTALEADAAPVGGATGLVTYPMLRLMASNPSLTLLADGRPVACGGVLQQWPGRYSGWAFLNPSSARHMVAVTRGTRNLLDALVGRIEMTVRVDFHAGHRWAKMLGFEIETPLLRAFGPEGEDHVGYVRLNGV